MMRLSHLRALVPLPLRGVEARRQLALAAQRCPLLHSWAQVLLLLVRLLLGRQTARPAGPLVCWLLVVQQQLQGRVQLLHCLQ